jgi:hypothetical protein
MKFQYIFLPLLICMTGCTTAFEIGEVLNKATTNIAQEKTLWGTVEPGSTNENILWATADPASATVATSTTEPNVSTPKEEAK